MVDTKIARVAHEVNRACCAGLGDDSQPTWEDAPKWLRDNTNKGVTFIREHPTAGPASNHARWMDEKLAAGWSYAPIKDVEKKKHPCMVEFYKLPREQQAKDFIFQAVVKALLG